MSINWKEVERWLMGEAFVGSRVYEHIQVLCDDIGVRWAGSAQEAQAAEYAVRCFEQSSLGSAALEEFDLRTFSHRESSLHVLDLEEQSWEMRVRPCLFCRSLDLKAPLVDVGYGTSSELERCAHRLPNSIAMIDSGFAPFSEPVALPTRLKALAERGVVAAITASPQRGRRLSHVSASDWLEDPWTPVLPLLQTTVEDASLLRRRISSVATMVARVVTEYPSATSWNATATLSGAPYSEESIVLGAHHDTTPDAPGANDNAAGVAVMLETARLLAKLTAEQGVRPGRNIRFVSFGGEEQGLQGSSEFVLRHYGPERLPRYMLALDELATGDMKGVVLQFPELRGLIQSQLDELGEGFRCHVLTQMDASGDMFPFARQGIPSSFLWRWRFVGRHADTSFGHSDGDTAEKVRVRELKEYAGFLARFLLRLSHVPPQRWPDDAQRDPVAVDRQIKEDAGAVFRTM